MIRPVGRRLVLVGMISMTVLLACSEPSDIQRVPVVQFLEDSVSVGVGDTIGVHLLPMLPPGYVPAVTWSSSSLATVTVSPQSWGSAMVAGVGVGEAVVSASGQGAADSVIVISSPAGWHGDWHPAPRRQLMFMLVGELEVRVSDGQVRRLSAGDVFLVEDTVGKGHVSTVVGDVRCFIANVPLTE